MKMREEKLSPMLIIDIGRARRLYDEGKNAEEIAAVVRRPVRGVHTDQLDLL